jgi:hypothetical protein
MTILQVKLRSTAEVKGDFIAFHRETRPSSGVRPIRRNANPPELRAKSTQPYRHDDAEEALKRFENARTDVIL